MKYIYWLIGIAYIVMAVAIVMGTKPTTLFSVTTCAITSIFFITTATKFR